MTIKEETQKIIETKLMQLSFNGKIRGTEAMLRALSCCDDWQTIENVSAYLGYSTPYMSTVFGQLTSLDYIIEYTPIKAKVYKMTKKIVRIINGYEEDGYDDKETSDDISRRRSLQQLSEDESPTDRRERDELYENRTPKNDSRQEPDGSPDSGKADVEEERKEV